MAEFRAFATRREAARELAKSIAAHLDERTNIGGSASLVVCGGSSPLEFFRFLRDQTLPWEYIQVLPSDERWVAPDDDVSNEGLIRRELLAAKATNARFVPLYRAGLSPEAAQPVVNQALADIGRPLDHVVLGMGSDGHTASLFPDAANLRVCLDSFDDCVVPDLASASPARLSLSLRCLCNARAIDVLIFGDDKRAVYEAALQSGDPMRYPIAGVLAQQDAPVRVFWAP